MRIKRFYLVYGASGRPLCNPSPSQPLPAVGWMTSQLTCGKAEEGSVEQSVFGGDSVWLYPVLCDSHPVFHQTPDRVSAGLSFNTCGRWTLGRFWVCC